MTFTLKFERRFSMAHRLLAGKSKKCAIPHGHNEFIRAYLTAPQEAPLNHQDNMITNFADAKQLWHHFIDESLDHSFQISQTDPLLNFFKENEPNLLCRLVICPGDPTTEILAACLMSKLTQLLSSINSPLVCSQLELEETPTNTVILSGHNSYLKHLPQGNYWWERADMTVNDL